MKRTFLGLALASLLVSSACSNSANESATDTATSSTMGTDSAATAGTMNSGAMPDSAMPATGAASADPSGPTAPHGTDAEFMQSAAASDQNEIQLSKLALEKSTNSMVKDHANMMIKDHSKSTADLKAIAQKKSVTLPPDMDGEHKAIAADMRKLSGSAFDKKYLDQMTTDHQKTLNTLAAHQKMTQDADVQGFITKTMPVVQGHLDMFKKHAAM